MAGVYLPQSDCECYYQALDLLNDALAPIDARITNIEGESKVYNGQSYETKPAGVPDGSVYFELDTGTTYCYYGDQWHEIPCCGAGGGGSGNVIYVNKFVMDWICDEGDKSPNPYEDLYDLLDEGYTLYYFCPMDGNMYWSTGSYDRSPVRIYFTTTGAPCTTVTDFWLGPEFSFFLSGKESGTIRQHFYGVDTNLSQSYIDDIDFNEYNTINPPSKSDIIGQLVCGSSSYAAAVEDAILMNNSYYRNCFYYFDSNTQTLDFYEFYGANDDRGRPVGYTNGANGFTKGVYLQYATYRGVGGDRNIILVMDMGVPI